jgi:hypothetical protein
MSPVSLMPARNIASVVDNSKKYRHAVSMLLAKNFASVADASKKCRNFTDTSKKCR